jgi:hypothetical protein
VNHTVAVGYTALTDFTARLSAPMFDGFKTATNTDGDEYTSQAYNRTLNTTVSVDADTGAVTYKGVYQDGGGYYTLTINADNTYSFHNYLITDVALYDDADEMHPQIEGTKFVYYLHRFMVESDVSGTITIDADGNVSSNGTSKTVILKMKYYLTGYNSGFNTTTNMLTIELSDGQAWYYNNFETQLMYYYNDTKSKNNSYALRNINAGYGVYYYDSADFIDSSATEIDLTYNNTTLRSKLWSITDSAPVFKADSANMGDMIAIKTDGVWSPMKWTYERNSVTKDLVQVRTRADLDAIWDAI